MLWFPLSYGYIGPWEVFYKINDNYLVRHRQTVNLKNNFNYMQAYVNYAHNDRNSNISNSFTQKYTHGPSHFFYGCFTTVWCSAQPADHLYIIVACSNGAHHQSGFSQKKTEEIQYLLP